MERKREVRGSIPEIVRNDSQVYEGNLIYYFRIIFNHASNLHNPYHNFGHLFYVMWRCHQACVFYKKMMSKREMRNLLIASMFHDIDHTGKAVPDAVNIARASDRLREYYAQEDENELHHILSIMKGSEYPYFVSSENSSLAIQILRDADASQVLGPAWIQHIVFGLAAERGKTPREMLEEELEFLGNLKFHTAWAQKLFPPQVVGNKMKEVEELLDLLYNRRAGSKT